MTALPPPPASSPEASWLVTVRVARPAEYTAVGVLTVDAYTLAGLLDDDAEYIVDLRDAARRAHHGDLLVAVDDRGTLLGTVTFCLSGSPYAELSRGRQAEFRMLAVDPAARGRGVGTRLVHACLSRAAGHGCESVVISTRPRMTAAHRLYRRLGFTRAPQLDWEPAPGFTLLAYTRVLDDDARQRKEGSDARF